MASSSTPGISEGKRAIGDFLTQNSKEPARFSPEFIDFTPHAKKLEDARLAVNRVLKERCTHEAEKRTQWQTLNSISTRYLREKETATEKADTEFEEEQAKARKQHEERKTDLLQDVFRRFEAEQIELEVGLRNLKAQTPNFIAREKTARAAFHNAEVVCAEEMTKRQIELENKRRAKRRREINLMKVMPSNRGDSESQESDEGDTGDRTPIKWSRRAPPVKKAKVHGAGV